MRPRRVRHVHRLLASMAVGALGAAAVLFSAEARADVLSNYVADNANLVCMFLDDFPSVEGFNTVAAAIVDDGLSEDAAAAVVARSVIALCPEHLRELNLFVARWQAVQA